MSEFAKSLLPQTRLGIWIGLTVLVVSFTIYYMGGPFSKLALWYEDQRWRIAEEKDSPSSEEDVRVSLVRIARYGADFLDSEAEVTLLNRAVISRTTSVRVELDSKEPRSYIYVATDNCYSVVNGYYHSQDGPPFCDNTVSLVVPSQGKVTIPFFFRLQYGDQSSYELHIFVDNQERFFTYPLSTQRDPVMRFRVWFTQLLLLPPGVNVVIPIAILLLVRWAEVVYEIEWKELTPWRVMAFILFTLIGSVAVCYALPENSSRTVFTIAFLMSTGAGLASYCHDKSWLTDKSLWDAD